jgi:hypothetical protein
LRAFDSIYFRRVFDSQALAALPYLLVDRAGGRGILLAWRENHLMKRGVRRKGTICQLEVAMTPNHQNVEM